MCALEHVPELVEHRCARFYDEAVVVPNLGTNRSSYSVCASTEIEPQGTVYCLCENNFESRLVLL